MCSLWLVGIRTCNRFKITSSSHVISSLNDKYLFMAFGICFMSLGQPLLIVVFKSNSSCHCLHSMIRSLSSESLNLHFSACMRNIVTNVSIFSSSCWNIFVRSLTLHLGSIVSYLVQKKIIRIINKKI